MTFAFERGGGMQAERIATFGRVPFFYFVALYPMCRWLAGVKARRSDGGGAIYSSAVDVRATCLPSGRTIQKTACARGGTAGR